jgi:hypothetical protein
LTFRLAHPERTPKLDALVRIFPAGAHHEVRSFLTTLLARRIAAGPAARQGQLKAALAAAWCEQLIITRWQRVALRMDATSCEDVAAALPAAASGCAPMRYLGLAQATEGWALGTGGMVLTETQIDGTNLRAATANLPAPRQDRSSAVHSHTTLSGAGLAI